MITAAKRATKINAARVLSAQGWAAVEIAAVLVADPQAVQRWLDDPDYKSRHSKTISTECRVCGSPPPLKTNGLCQPCMDARADTIIDMRSNGYRYRDIAEAVGTSHATIRQVIQDALMQGTLLEG